MRLVPSQVVITVHARRRKANRVTEDQLKIPELITITTRAVKIYRPTPGLVARYAGLAEIDPDEWFEYFPKTGKEWSDEDRDYLIEWWGREDVMSLAYALERPPWGLQREVCRLRRAGVSITYLRHDM